MNALLSSSFTNEELKKKKDKEKKNRVTEQPFTHTHTQAKQTNKQTKGGLYSVFKGATTNVQLHLEFSTT